MLKIDLHLHTVASGHAQSTVLEYVNQAKKLKMKVIGISDHGPGNTETIVSEIYFMTLKRLPKKIGSLRLLRGIEANIINKNGDIDINDSVIKGLDYVMANFHKNTNYHDQGKNLNTEVMIKTIRSGKVNIISHPFLNKLFPLDLKKISEEACRNNVLLELNLSALAKSRKEDYILPNVRIMLGVVKKFKKKVIIGSDSHNIWELADDSYLQAVKKKISLTDNLAINNYPRELFKLLKIAD
jgi:putative hydrolase